MLAAGWAPLILLVALLDPASAAASEQEPAASCQDNPGHTVTTCRVDKPVVTQRAFQYRGIRFRAGDVVTIEAGGCVNAGTGAGWRRFVDPTGRDADRFYDGLIRIPGHPPGGGLVRIQTLVGRPLTIPTPLPPGNSFLSLGYEDIDYRDNGYANHADGIAGQCRVDRDGGPAWVALTIRHGGVTASGDRAPLDLVSDELGGNGDLLNPRFFWETRHSDHPNTSVLCDGFPYRSRLDETRGVVLGTPPCSTDVADVDVASGFNAVLCRATGAPDKLHGHLSFSPATITGRITWTGHSDWVQKGDDDYGFHLYPANDGMLTSSHPAAIDVEFDSDETIDHFGSGWWRSFQDAVDKSDGNATENSGSARMVDDREAVVTGLAGIAAEHEAVSQLHPVYAMALHLSSDAADDRWAFFARNWGNQGFCSSDQHYWDVSPLSLFIPGPRGATDFRLIDQDVKANRDFAIRASFTNGGVLFSFDLGAPESHALADGSVRIRWTVPPPTSGSVVAAGNNAASTFGPSIRSRLTTQQRMNGRAEDLTLTAGLTPERVAQVRRQLAQPAPVRNAHSIQIARVAAVASPPAARPTKPSLRAVPDPAKLEKETRRANAICAAQRASVPSLTAACAEARR
ncbi:MAG TPA: hypothetical protein VI259_18465 [Gemmatimonadaceae bacterium]